MISAESARSDLMLKRCKVSDWGDWCADDELRCAIALATWRLTTRGPLAWTTRTDRIYGPRVTLTGQRLAGCHITERLAAIVVFLLLHTASNQQKAHNSVLVPSWIVCHASAMPDVSHDARCHTLFVFPSTLLKSIVVCVAG